MPRRPAIKLETEFSRLFLVQNLGKKAIFKKYSASKKECLALAKRFNLASLEFIVGELKIQKSENDRIYLDGKILAKYTQICVITLEPVQTNLNNPIKGFFIEDSGFFSETLEFDLLEEQFIELIENNTIDFGELLAQLLAISINPYPKASNMVTQEKVLKSSKNQIHRNLSSNSSPFEVLKALKSK